MAGPKIWDEKTKIDSKRITVDPITRLEGHGKIEIFLDDAGNVENAYWQVPELRGFERFCIGRKVTEMNQITARLCGVCPGAHHLERRNGQTHRHRRDWENQGSQGRHSGVP